MSMVTLVERGWAPIQVPYDSPDVHRIYNTNRRIKTGDQLRFQVKEKAMGRSGRKIVADILVGVHTLSILTILSFTHTPSRLDKS